MDKELVYLLFRLQLWCLQLSRKDCILFAVLCNLNFILPFLNLHWTQHVLGFYILNCSAPDSQVQQQFPFTFIIFFCLRNSKCVSLFKFYNYFIINLFKSLWSQHVLRLHPFIKLLCCEVAVAFELDPFLHAVLEIFVIFSYPI